jgi:hypothetical protein
MRLRGSEVWSVYVDIESHGHSATERRATHDLLDIVDIGLPRDI